MSSSHFAGQDAKTHVIEKKEEIHGIQLPQVQSLGIESAKETAVVLLVVGAAGLFSLLPLMACAVGMMVWKGGSQGVSAWRHLERLHRLIEQEKYEIEHHREQERQELVALYSSKGFQGKLLDDVVETLMADPDRLLKVMLEEEMGLVLDAYEHPLKYAFGAFFGSFLAAAIVLLLHYFFPITGMIVGVMLVLGVTSFLQAKREESRLVSALIWNLALGALSFGIARIFL